MFDPIKTQPTGAIPDLLSYLWDAYRADRPGREDGQTDCRGTAIQGFIEFARVHMRQNQPTGLDYLSQGMGIRLQDGTVVSWVAQEDSAPVQGDPGSIPISQPKTAAFKQGIQPGVSFPITSGKTG